MREVYCFKFQEFVHILVKMMKTYTNPLLSSMHGHACIIIFDNVNTD